MMNNRAFLVMFCLWSVCAQAELSIQITQGSRQPNSDRYCAIRLGG